MVKLDGVSECSAGLFREEHLLLLLHRLHLLFEVLDEELTLAPGQSESIEVIVKPPTDLTQSDTFTFTVFAQPEGDPDLRQPIDMQVTAHPAASFFGTSDTIGLAAMGLLLLLVVLAMVTTLTSRRDDE